MTRKLKGLGLALVAVLALSAVGASGASAVTNDIEVGTGDGFVHATQIAEEPFILTYAGGRTIACPGATGATFKGAMATTSSTITVTPTYSGCHSILAGVTLDATVTMNGCNYVVHVGETTGVDLYSGTIDLECPGATKHVLIHVYKEGTPTTEEAHTNTANMLCQYTIAPVTGLTHVSIEENTAASPRDVKVTLNITAVPYTRSLGTIANCGAAAGNFTLKGAATAKGETTALVSTGLEIIET